MGKWHGSCSSDEAIEHALPQRGVRMESSVYQRARQEWDERYADLVLGKRNWQIAAGGLLLLSLILASASPDSAMAAVTSRASTTDYSDFSFDPCDWVVRKLADS